MNHIPFQEIREVDIRLSAGGRLIEMTPLVAELALYENIHFPFTYGQLSLIDNSGLMSDAPLTGQQEVAVSMKMHGSEKEIDRVYFASGFSGAAGSPAAGWSGVKIPLLSHDQIADGARMISRRMSGGNADMAAQLFEEHFRKRVVRRSQGQSVHNLVIPYTTPIRAIQSILKHTWADDHTPLYLYDTLWQLPSERNTVTLKSWGAMARDRAELAGGNPFTPQLASNRDLSEGAGTRRLHKRLGQMSEYRFGHCYDTYRLMMSGAYAHRIEHIDLGDKSYRTLRYDYREHRGDLQGDDYIDDRFHASVAGGEPLVIRRYTNSSSYAGPHGGLYDVDMMSRSRALQVEQRAGTVELTGAGSYDPAVAPGRSVRLEVRRDIPAGPGEEEVDRRLNSGWYVVEGIEHRWKPSAPRPYTARYQMSRDGPARDIGALRPGRV